MSAIAETAYRGQARRRMRIDGWRWGGRIFLVFMLLYTALPMIWMLSTSIKSGHFSRQVMPILSDGHSPSVALHAFAKLRRLDPRPEFKDVAASEMGQDLPSRPDDCTSAFHPIASIGAVIRQDATCH